MNQSVLPGHAELSQRFEGRTFVLADEADCEQYRRFQDEKARLKAADDQAARARVYAPGDKVRIRADWAHGGQRGVVFEVIEVEPYGCPSAHPQKVKLAAYVNGRDDWINGFYLERADG